MLLVKSSVIKNNTKENRNLPIYNGKREAMRVSYLTFAGGGR
jgi:hypothetical protein